MSGMSGLLPRWNLDPVAPPPGSPEFTDAVAAVIEGIAGLTALFDERGVRRHDPTALNDAVVASVETIIPRYNDVLEAAEALEHGLVCRIFTDASDTLAQGALSELEPHLGRLAQLGARFAAWAGSLDIEALIERSTIARDHAAALHRARDAAAHLMSPAEEELAAELGAAGSRAWSRLRQEIEANLTAPVDLDGTTRERPIGEIAGLSLHEDREVRRRAQMAATTAWASVAMPLVAALNATKAEVLTLTGRRGWADPLESALAANHIDRPILDAMLTAIREAYPDYRRYLRAKARVLGLPVLAWSDRAAPIGTTRPWLFGEAAAFIVERFSAYEPKLGAFATQALSGDWIDAEPRAGKVGGGACFPFRHGVSRILLNYVPSGTWLGALAHELGHAYHHAVQHEAGRTLLQRSSPPPIALLETASTFCESLIQRAAVAEARATEEVAALDGVLMAVGNHVFSSAYEFAFERELFATRRQREWSVEEINALMLAAQREVAGDAIDHDTFFPFRWAALPHFFLPDTWFYNFPYAFGMLFSRGLHARHDADLTSFWPAFDDLLSRTGMAGAAELAAGVGVDLRSPDFWRASLDSIRSDIDRFEALTA